MGKSKRTDFRKLKALRERALTRPELKEGPRPAPPGADEIAQAIAAGRLQKLPAGRKRASISR